MKYIIVSANLSNGKTVNLPFIFPDFMIHLAVYENVKQSLVLQYDCEFVHIISAGETVLNGTGIKCFGESTSLGVVSRGIIDASLIELKMGLL